MKLREIDEAVLVMIFRQRATPCARGRKVSLATVASELDRRRYFHCGNNIAEIARSVYSALDLLHASGLVAGVADGLYVTQLGEHALKNVRSPVIQRLL